MSRPRSWSSAWGPWRLKYGCDGADEYGRRADPRRGLGRGERTKWALAPAWCPTQTADPLFWEHEQRGKPMRIYLVAVADGRAWEFLPELVSGQTVCPAPGGAVAAVPRAVVGVPVVSARSS